MSVPLAIVPEILSIIVALLSIFGISSLGRLTRRLVTQTDKFSDLKKLEELRDKFRSLASANVIYPSDFLSLLEALRIRNDVDLDNLQSAKTTLIEMKPHVGKETGRWFAKYQARLERNAEYIGMRAELLNEITDLMEIISSKLLDEADSKEDDI